ncbi:MAG TPA: 5'/3'-nucleotidase SurE [Ferrovibrio sp.]|jgi:5'-nucleotidase|uniref:5'/3'-nucleotidase SurE n=1 Tax=Ferrovibrio sp. TaxID=1917215 RepID=UPI002B4B2320|nr:5'/3'-nucleotidase SurE [Ferrovibrio sp.]HLT77229.1 5'/3'-nucleotidase SurE [Ferrovibrio sp.]
MRILVSNDDGIHAPGLKILEKVARTLSKDIWVVAPEYEQSGASHSLTLTQPLRIRKVGPRKFAVRGTPTDCVMMAIHELMKDKRPDLLLSGVNRGANLGEDVTYSGTVAVAMEGTLLGVPSIALSQCFQFGHPVKWATAEHHAPKVIRKLLKAGWPKGVLINVNFPDVIADSVTGIEVVKQGQRDLTDLVLDHRIDARGVPYYWIGFRRQKSKAKRQSDLGATENGAISVTPLQLDLTQSATLKALRSALK